MNRYSYTTNSQRWDGKAVRNTLLMPRIPISQTDIYIITNETMYLDQIANSYYGDPSLYWIIAIANNLGSPRLSVPIGIQLRIPANPSIVLSQLQIANS